MKLNKEQQNLVNKLNNLVGIRTTYDYFSTKIKSLFNTVVHDKDDFDKCDKSDFQLNGTASTETMLCDFTLYYLKDRDNNILITELWYDFEDIEPVWHCTDADNLQYCKRLSTYKFLYKEFDRRTYHKEFEEYANGSRIVDDFDFKKGVFGFKDFWIEAEINLEEYTIKQIDDCTSAYNPNIDELAKTYGTDTCMIMAECIFEIEESGLY